MLTSPLTASFFNDIAAALAAARALEQFKVCLSDIATTLGFTHFYYSGVSYESLTQSKQMVLSNYPETLLNGAYAGDPRQSRPALTHAVLIGEPVVWSKALFAKNPAVFVALKDGGLATGWSVTTLHQPMRIGFLEFARAKTALSSEEQMFKQGRFRYFADLFERRLAEREREQAQEDGPPAPALFPYCPLTDREIEILRWTADGKTADDIGLILHISSRTVSFHLGNIMLVLGAPNKTAAVSRAQLFGWLY